MMMGTLCTGSIIRPFTCISISMDPSQLKRRGARDPNRHETPDPGGWALEIHHHIASGSAAELVGSTHRVHEDILRRADTRLIELELDLALRRLECHDAPRLFRFRHIVRHPLRCERVRADRILEGK